MSFYLLDDSGNILTNDSGSDRLIYSASGGVYSLAAAAGSYLLSGVVAVLHTRPFEVHFRRRKV